MTTVQYHDDEWWPKFNYASVPLRRPSSEIRVAHVHPNDQEIIGIETPVLELVTIDLDDNEHMIYDTLSYTWGQAADTLPPEWNNKDYTFPIYVNGYRFDVRPNLFYALLEMQAKSSPTGQCDPIWIDAVCIDQDNTEEKNIQVGRMQDIYSCCEIVYVWLGPDDGMSEAALKIITDISTNHGMMSQGSQSMLAGDSSMYMEILGQSLDHFLRENYSESGRRKLDSFLVPIQALMRRSWWDRAWVWQEVCRAPMAVFWIGPYVIDWKTLTDVYFAWAADMRTLAQWENRPQYIDLFLASLHDEYAVRLQLSNLQSRWTESSPPQDPPSLVPSLRYLRQTEASNPKDKVYAALGLCRPEDRVRVDYALTVEEIFASVVAKHIENYNDLTIFNDCQYPPQISTLPSWIPDWTDRRFARRPKIDPNTYDFPDEARYCRYSAGGLGSSSRHILISDDLRKLSTEAFALDKIEFAANISRLANWQALPTRDALNLKPYAFSTDFSDLLPTRYASWLRQWSALNPTGGHHSAPAYHYRILQSRRRHIKRRVVFTRRWRYLRDGDTTQYDKLTYWPTEETVLDAYTRTLAADAVIAKPRGSYRHRMMDFTNPTGDAEFDFDLDGRTFATSYAHAFLLVPRETLPGDDIVFVKGEEFPYIMRAKEQSYLMIGDCYIHGFMDGEALRLIEQNGGWRNIELV